MEPSVTVVNAKDNSNFFFKNLKFIIPGIIFLILVILNLNYIGIISLPLKQNKILPQTQNIVEKSSLAVPYPILQNPMVYEWRGSIEGTLISKTNDSITLSRDDKTTTIIIKPGKNGTKISFQPSFTSTSSANKNISSTQPEYVSLEQVPLERWLVGDFFVLPNDDKLYGSSFLIMPKGYKTPKRI